MFKAGIHKCAVRSPHMHPQAQPSQHSSNTRDVLQSFNYNFIKKRTEFVFLCIIKLKYKIIVPL